MTTISAISSIELAEKILDLVRDYLTTEDDLCIETHINWALADQDNYLSDSAKDKISDYVEIKSIGTSIGIQNEKDLAFKLERMLNSMIVEVVLQ